MRYKEEIFHYEGGEALEQVAQRSCACPIPGSVQGQAGWGWMSNLTPAGASPTCHLHESPRWRGEARLRFVPLQAPALCTAPGVGSASLPRGGKQRAFVALGWSPSRADCVKGFCAAPAACLR
ncbi:hypothetical protein QYF61_016828 [Mycteria americana]|uniref:Uncharacterized protein n=1 Tax=Mycteria americana TaxID=33587 RepID=A0AAN7SD02_MYCAM|nr:hypothetical protein QYF61_016828 [Mycteria americana]